MRGLDPKFPGVVVDSQEKRFAVMACLDSDRQGRDMLVNSVSSIDREDKLGCTQTEE